MKMTGMMGLLKDAGKDFMDDECPVRAAALSYYIVFSLPPLLILILLIAVLAKLGHKVDRLKVPFLRPIDDSETARERTLIARWGRFVTGHARAVFIVALLVRPLPVAPFVCAWNVRVYVVPAGITLPGKGSPVTGSIMTRTMSAFGSSNFETSTQYTYDPFERLLDDSGVWNRSRS